jgi:hypothetical protein
VTSLTQFSRSIGGTLGAAVFGSLLANRFGPSLQAALPSQVAAGIPAEQLAQLQNPQVLLNPESAAGLQSLPGYDALIGAIRVALASSLHDVFLAGSVIVAVGVVLVLFLKEIPLRKSFGPAEAPAAARPAGQPAEQPAPAPALAAVAEGDD